MVVNKFTGKDYDNVLKVALASLNLNIDDVVVFKSIKKQGLFKDDLIELTVTPINDILEFAKSTLENIISTMNIEVNFETEKLKIT